MKPTKFKETEIGLIPEDWEVKELKETASYITEKISLVDINLNNFISTENMLPEKGGITVASSLPKVGKVTQFREGDILFSNIRTYFKKFWLAEFSGGCSNDVLVIRKKSSINNKYLYYYLSQDNFFEFTVLTSKGTKMPRGDKNSIMSYEINIPSFPEQIAIAKILSDLDSKIELNQQMNKTLEAIGKAIFKRWFVDFEFPSEEGKPYKSSGGEMVHNEELDKEIPKGWNVGKLGELGKIQPGFAFKSKDFLDDGIGLAKIKNIQPPLMDFNFESYISEELYNKTNNRFYLFSGDVLIAMTGAKIGKIGIIPKTEDKILLNQRVGKVESNNKYLMYLILNTNEIQGLISGGSSASSAQGNISNSDIENFIYLIPNEIFLQKINKMMNYLFVKMIDNLGEIQNLSQIRDSLLPRLMSGKIRVPIEVRA
ncbi:restriction endonuclease subunit S [Candidatus Woesearchaeota archaeon]|nr:restriction endonuclease subunit S [Candidatus Woesearchaeota archaeon]